MLTVDVKVDTKEVMRSLRGLGVDMPKASARALTDGARKMNSSIKKPLQQLMGLKSQSQVKLSNRYRRATPQRQIARLISSYPASGVPLNNFKGFRVTKKKGVYANVMGKTRHVPDGFEPKKYKADRRTFKREGRKSKPIVELGGPSVPLVLLNRKIRNIAYTHGIETFNKRLSHYVRQALKRRKLL